MPMTARTGIRTLVPRIALVALAVASTTNGCSRSKSLQPNSANVASSYSDPAWNPSGTAIVFNHEPLVRVYTDPATGRFVQVFAESLLGFWTANADGSGERRLLPYYMWEPDWDSTGTTIAYQIGGYILTMAGSDTGLVSESARQVTAEPVGTYAPTWSPDGLLLACSVHIEPEAGVYVVPKSGGSTRRIASEWYHPDWSPRGDSLVFLAPRVDRTEIAVADTSGQGLHVLWGQPESSARYPRWSPDGSKIAFTGRSNNSDMIWRLWIMDATGANARPVTSEGTLEFFSWSPNGQEIAYVRYNYGDTSLTNGTIWIVNIASGAKRQVTFNHPSS